MKKKSEIRATVEFAKNPPKNNNGIELIRSMALCLERTEKAWRREQE